jgi:hypothetical protein
MERLYARRIVTASFLPATPTLPASSGRTSNGVASQILTMMDGMGWTSPEAYELFNLVVRHQADERRKHRERIFEALNKLPTTEDTLDQLCALSPQDFERVMRAHPAYKTQRKIESVQTMLKVFHRAMTDLEAAVASFPALGPPDARTEREALELELSICVNKELLAAVDASQALVAYSRRVKDQLPTDNFDKKRKEIFDENEHELVKDLRNLLGHRLHTAANWQTVYSKDGRYTHFKIDAEDLLAEAELTAPAKQHLATQAKPWTSASFFLATPNGWIGSMGGSFRSSNGISLTQLKTSVIVGTP